MDILKMIFKRCAYCKKPIYDLIYAVAISTETENGKIVKKKKYYLHTDCSDKFVLSGRV